MALDSGRRVASVMLHTAAALLFNLGGLLAGRFIAASSSQSLHPWFLALLPPILTVRGDISGIFSGRLTTMLHIGTARPSIRGNTEEYYNLVKAVVVLTIIDSLGISLISYTMNLAAGQAGPSELPVYILIPTVTCLLTVSITNPVTTLLASGTFRLGLDPDYLVYPAMATINDVVVSATYLATVYMATTGKTGILWLAFASSLTLSLYLLYSLRRDRTFNSCVMQGAPSVLFSSLLATISGVALARVRKTFRRKPEILVVYPTLMSSLGSLGSILGSVATTQIALGTASYMRSMYRDFVIIEASAIPVYSLYAVVGYGLCRATGISASLTHMLLVSLLNNLLGFMAVSALALVVAFGTFRRGWDPDHFVIPVVTSISDALSTLLIFLGLLILGIL